jgi:hypothetical protein
MRTKNLKTDSWKFFLPSKMQFITPKASSKDAQATYSRNLLPSNENIQPRSGSGDPHVFGPPGSVSISQRCGSGSFCHPYIIKQNSKKNLDSYCFVTTFGIFILKNYVNVHSKSNNKQKNFFFKYFLLAS